MCTRTQPHWVVHSNRTNINCKFYANRVQTSRKCMRIFMHFGCILACMYACEFACISVAIRMQKNAYKNAYKMYANHVQTTCKRHANLHTFGCILHAFLHANCVRNACKSCANFTQDAIEFVSISVAIRKQKCIQNVCILHSGAPVEWGRIQNGYKLILRCSQES